ncbi:MAG: hypothetical protein J0L84_17445 [Verrucomicrobia bacterium]|nr:hypothetical protein [Verrucomicrobiota bacterium]
MSEAVELRDGEDALAVVHPDLGAWLTRYARQLPGRGWVDALHHDEAVVARYPDRMWAGAPVLFPHVSYNVAEGHEGRYVLNGTSYESPQHGFARRVPWTVVDRSAASVTLELRDSERTRPSYPFAFRHRLTYRLESGRLVWHQMVENRDQQPLPFSAGFHPYLRVPLAGTERNRCVVRLPRCRRFHPVDQASAFFDEPLPAQDLSIATDASGTLFLGELASREVALRDPVGGVEVALQLGDNPAYRFLALWAPDTTAPFFCIEPWTALPNSFGRGDGELVVLKPGEHFEASLSLELRPMTR